MKFLTVFAAILAVALGGRAQWNLNQLSEALESPHTNPSLVPILEQALNAYMAAMFAGENHQSISIMTAPVDLSTWTLSELSEAVENPNTNPAILPHLENALNSLMSAIFAGEAQPTTAQVAVVIPALEISYWTLADLDQALSNPATNPALIPYLEQSLNHIMENLFSGVQQTFIVLATPLGFTAVTPEAVVAPEVVIDPVQVVEEVLDAPVQPVVVANPSVVSGSPLVQIILNIKQQSAAPEVVAPAPVVLPDNTEAYPNPRPPAPVNPRPPAPVIVPPTPLPTPEVQPEPVIVVPDYNPIDVIAINPETLNPIEAVAISPPEVNPVDLLNPVIVPGVVIGGDIGPMFKLITTYFFLIATMKFLAVFLSVLAVTLGSQAPVKPAVVAKPAAASESPLVQIILNINQESAAAPEVVAPAPVILPDNTEVYPNPRPPAPVNPRPPAPTPEVQPEPVIVVPSPEVQPEPVIVVPSPEIQPEPVIVVPDYNPIDVIAINPETINPIEAVAISPPEVNPVDLLNPVIVPGVVIGGDIGPM
ncbi:calphotin [Amyelois transitella]|uniref:calphotin n=1 Tax=Amyelois transitella TaxID=680683 RepID=UPI00298F654D|nr:calphotin [Amyelois transitella]